MENLPTIAVTTEYLKIIILLTLDINHLNPHQATSVLVQIMRNDLYLNPTVNYRMNYLTKIVRSLLNTFNVSIFMTMVVGMFTNIMTRYGSFITFI